MSLGLGIDTGGTYTDAVLLDFEMKRVISKAKALTTYPNLEMGIAEVLETLENNTLLTATNSAKSEITLVAISTTLATNAMVEGKGGHVCLLAIGYLPDLLEERGVDKQPFVELHHIAGGHILTVMKNTRLILSQLNILLKRQRVGLTLTRLSHWVHHSTLGTKSKLSNC